MVIQLYPFKLTAKVAVVGLNVVFVTVSLSNLPIATQGSWILMVSTQSFRVNTRDI